ncbi:hypothetical protein [Accumulibacter sp.]|uniref:hypothetical protein n=1 Tax=Accumulibacter sp. TaxID=2053492 RepID=UPI0035B20464
MRDISERKRAAQQLQESERQYRELGEGPNSIMLRRNRQGETPCVNAFGLGFLCSKEKELVGQYVAGTVVPPDEGAGRHRRPLMEASCRHPEQFEQNVRENMLHTGGTGGLAYRRTAAGDGAIGAGREAGGTGPSGGRHGARAQHATGHNAWTVAGAFGADVRRVAAVVPLGGTPPFPA